MARARSMTAALKELSETTGPVDVQAATETLRTALAGSSSPVVAEAAELAGRFGVTKLGADLQSAYERFCEAGLRADKFCRAKIAIIRALHLLKSERTEPYLHGMSCYWPARPRRNNRDEAATLRVAAAHAYADLGSPTEMEELAGLLADPVDDVRFAAVQAIAALGGVHFGPLMRLKTLLGDENPSIVEACFDALIERDKNRYIPLIASHLDDENPRVRIAAALTLGRSRHPAAFEILSGKVHTPDDELRNELFVAIALLRSDTGIDYLLSFIENNHRYAMDTLAALKFCHVPQIREKILAVLDRAESPHLRNAFEELFK